MQGVDSRWCFGRTRRTTNYCQPLWRGYRPSDATWKQRLGLITLTPRWVMRLEGLCLLGGRTEAQEVTTEFSYVAPGRNDIVVFGPFFFFLPLIYLATMVCRLGCLQMFAPPTFFCQVIFVRQITQIAALPYNASPVQVIQGGLGRFRFSTSPSPWEAFEVADPPSLGHTPNTLGALQGTPARGEGPTSRGRGRPPRHRRR